MSCIEENNKAGVIDPGFECMSKVTSEESFSSY